MGERSFHETSEDSDNDDGATVQPHEDTADSQSGEQEASPQSAVQVEDIQLGEPEQQPLRRSERASRPVKQWWVVERPSANIASTNGINVPASYKQALRSTEWSHWQEAIDTEYKSLQERQTWTLVVKPAGRKIIDSKWVFKIKRNSDGTIARYKARLVARGFTQEHGIDYTETFAPTVKFSTIRVILTLAAYHDWEVEQLDVVTAFLSAELKEKVYMRQPEGFHECGDDGNELVCELHRAIYGLKQSPRYWYQTITAWLLEFGFVQSAVDPCVYVFVQGDITYILALYVDDTILTGPIGDFITRFKLAFGSRFDVQDLGPVSWLLGTTVVRDRRARTITLGQRQYLLDILERFNMGECNSVATPLAKGGTDSDGTSVIQSDVPYNSLIGSLQYAAITTRPDISMAVSHLSRFLTQPSTKHWEAGKRVLRYLKGTIDLGLVLGGQDSCIMTGYCDSDWASDTVTRRSRTGYVFTMNGGAVSWKSQHQPTVALSTAEAEYMALTAAIQEAIFLRQLLDSMGVKQLEPTMIFEDNQACIALSKNSLVNARSKHIDIKYHFNREKVESGEVVLKYCPSAEMIADVMTKPLPAPQHRALIKLMMGGHA
jgi:hypothetical protein